MNHIQNSYNPSEEEKLIWQFLNDHKKIYETSKVQESVNRLPCMMRKDKTNVLVITRIRCAKTTAAIVPKKRLSSTG